VSAQKKVSCSVYHQFLGRQYLFIVVITYKLLFSQHQQIMIINKTLHSSGEPFQLCDKPEIICSPFDTLIPVIGKNPIKNVLNHEFFVLSIIPIPSNHRGEPKEKCVKPNQFCSPHDTIT